MLGLVLLEGPTFGRTISTQKVSLAKLNVPADLLDTSLREFSIHVLAAGEDELRDNIVKKTIH